MSLFVCDNCKAIENTALCLYWTRGDGPALCSECDPKLKRWHNHFPKEKFNKKKWRYIEGRKQFVEQIK